MVMGVAEEFSRSFPCIKCEVTIGDAVEQEERLCDEVPTVDKTTYLGDSVQVAAVAPVSARTRSK